VASVIVLFIFLISSLNDLKSGGWLATQSTPLDLPLLRINCDIHLIAKTLSYKNEKGQIGINC